MTTQTVQHGTRSGYRHGCRTDAQCPNTPSCREAAMKYQRDLRQAHQAARARRKPVVAGKKPKTSGIRVVSGLSRSQPHDAQDQGGAADSGTMPDMATFDPPDSLLNARVQDDPEPAESQHDVYNEPEFIVTPAIRNDVAGKMGLFAIIIGLPFEAMDPYCGNIFANNVENIIDKTVPIICRSPGAVKFFTSTTGGWMEWVAMIQAWWPVLTAIYAHHLARTVSRDKHAMPDATMPPAPDSYDYSAA
jgi:hypothetical protein